MRRYPGWETAGTLVARPPAMVTQHTHGKHSRMQIRIQAPARLHLGFLDLNGGLGRRFGSIGLALEAPATCLRLETSHGLSANGVEAQRALRYARRLADELGLQPRGHIQVEHAIPDHIGLGSGTQLALAVGVGLASLHRQELTARDIAAVTERGARSGIGIGSFEHGGFVLDGGRGQETDTPPLLVRAEFPDQWRAVLVLDSRGQGLHGQQEMAAFQTLPEFPAADSAHLCRLVLMRMLPALAEQNLVAFGAAITELQQRLGDHFAPAQGGRFTSPAVGEALRWLESRGATGIGQSSWGPTGFCFVDNEAQADALACEARVRFANRPELQFRVAKARNGGCVPIAEPLGHGRSGTLT